MPREGRLRRTGSSVDKSRRCSGARARRETGALSLALYPERDRHGTLLALRDDDLGLRQPRYALREGADADTERGVRPDGLPALQKRRHSRRAGTRRSESAAGENAEP